MYRIGPPISSRRHWRLHDCADFDGARPRRRDSRGNTDRFVQILGLDEEEAAELLPRFREWTGRDDRFPVAHLDASARRSGLQLIPRHKVAGGSELIPQLAVLVIQALPIGFAEAGKGLLVVMNQQDVFHGFGPPE
jgi:hypothetical protein